MQKDPKGKTFGLHSSLIIPIAALSLEAISKYVGEATPIDKEGNGYIVNFEPLGDPNDLEIWTNPRTSLLHNKKQLWIDIEYKGYRNTYKKVFPDIDLNGFDVDHIFNRGFARLYNFRYVRLLHVSSSFNRKTGAGIEKDSVQFRNHDFVGVDYEIQYADVTDMCKLLHLEIGTGVYLDVIDSFHLFYGVNKKFNI